MNAYSRTCGTFHNVRWNPGSYRPHPHIDIRAETDGGTVRLDINGPIGWDGISAADIVTALEQHKGASQIDVHLSSPGGSAFDGVQIYNNLRRHPATVRVLVDGYAASAGSIIAMAGDEIIMGPGSMMMIHNARGSVYSGSAEDMTVAAELLRKSNDSMAGLYARRAGGTVDAWLTVMKGEQWYTAEEAVDAGLADRVEDYAQDDNGDDMDMVAVAELGVTVFGWRYPGRDTAPPPVPIAQIELPAADAADAHDGQDDDDQAQPVSFLDQLDAFLIEHDPIAQLSAMLAGQKGQ